MAWLPARQLVDRLARNAQLIEQPREAVLRMLRVLFREPGECLVVEGGVEGR